MYTYAITDRRSFPHTLLAVCVPVLFSHFRYLWVVGTRMRLCPEERLGIWVGPEGTPSAL